MACKSPKQIGGGEFTTSENENLDDVTANAPTNSGYWTDAGNYATSFAGGTGTEDDPYLISTPQQLAYLSYLVNNSSTNSSYRSLYYEQTTNLNMSAYWWDAIGYSSSSYYFGGHYNGGGFTIAGLYTEAGTTSSYSYQGLFGYIEGTTSNFAEIHDVGIIDSNIQGYQYIGGIAGYAYSSTITNCYNTGSVTGSSDYVGGIAGYASSSTITNCYNTGLVTGSGYVGGITGWASGSTILKCYSDGSVITSGDNSGGIAGFVTDSEFKECYNIGSVSGLNYIGGIIGSASFSIDAELKSWITECYNSGSVNGELFYLGGIVGLANSCIISNCYNIGLLSGPDAIGGIVGMFYGEIYNSYNNGEILSSDATTIGSIVSIVTTSKLYNCYSGENDSEYDFIGADDTMSILANCNEVANSQLKSSDWYINSANWHSSFLWDFENTWEINSSINDGYPFLSAFIKFNTISFDANGGQGSMDSVEVEPNSSVTLPSCTFTRTGYEFAGWALSSTGVVVYSDEQTITPTASMTLYAVWRAEVYTITLDWQGGSGATWSTIYFRYGGSNFYSNESCTTMINASGLLNGASRAGFSFVSFTTNADGSGTVMFQNSEYLNLNTIVADDIWYAQWTPNVVAKYDSAGDYWYIENGKIPQTKVTDSGLISSLNSATTNGGNYYIAGQTLTAKMYNGTEYCKWNNNWYEVEPIRWRLDASSSQKDGYGTTTDTNAVLAEIVFVGQYSSTYLGSGAGYSTTAVEEFKKNGIDEKYLVDYQNEAYNFGNGTTMYNLYKDYTNMFVANESEINSVSTTTAIEFSDLAKDIIKSYGGTNVYFTRDLGSNYNNITCFNEVGVDSQRFATDFRGVQFTIRFTEYACVD